MNKLWIRSLFSLLCVGQLLFAAHVCRAEDDDTPAEKLLPKDTLLFFTIPDVPELKEKFAKTSFGQLFQDEKMKPFLNDVEKKKGELSQKIEDEVGVSLDDLLAIPQGEVTFGLWEKPARSVSVVLMVDFGDSDDTVTKLLKKMDESLEKEGAEHSTEEISDVKVHVYKLKNEESENPLKTLVYFSDDDSLVFSNEVDAIKDVLGRWKGDSNDSLADNPQYKHIQDQCKGEGDAQVKFFVNPAGLITTVMGIAQASNPQVGMAAGFLPMLGFDAMKGYGGTVSLDEGDYESIAKAYFYTDSVKGILGLFTFPATNLTPPKWVPATIASYTGLNWDFNAAYKAVESLYDTFQGRGATARILDQLADQEPNIHIKKDILDLLDGKIHVVQNETKDVDSDDPGVPDAFVALALKDAGRMKKTLAAAVQAAGSSVESREFNGETIYDIPLGGTTLSIAINDGHLMITNDSDVLEGIMRGRSGQGAPLIESAEYKRNAKHFPAKTSIMSFSYSVGQMKLYYNLLKNMDVDPDEGVDVSKLPSFDVIAKYLLPSAGYCVPDGKGFKSVQFTLKKAE